jgi:hypothetical protein
MRLRVVAVRDAGQGAAAVTAARASSEAANMGAPRRARSRAREV